MDIEFAPTVDDASPTEEAADPRSFVRVTSARIIADLVDAVMQNEPCLALTGPPGCGKTTAAAAIRDDLARRSVRVLSVHRGGGDILRLRDIASQLVGEPESMSDDDHAEQLFTLMTTRAPGESHLVLMIDDADLLQTNALEYLRLMSSIPTVVVPQFLFVGRPQFWDAVDHAASGQFKERITARWELGRLSADTACVFIDRLLGSAGLSGQNLFGDGGLAALVQSGGGLFGRIVSLLEFARTIQEAKREPLLTASIVDLAAAMLDAREAGSPADNDTAPGVVTDSILVETPPASPFRAPDERREPEDRAEPDNRQDPAAPPAPDDRSPSETHLPPGDLTVLPPAARTVPDHDAGPPGNAEQIAAPSVANRSARWRPWAYAAVVAILLCIPAGLASWPPRTARSKALPPDIVAATNLSAPAGTEAPAAEASTAGTVLASPGPAAAHEATHGTPPDQPLPPAEVAHAEAAPPAASNQPLPPAEVAHAKAASPAASNQPLPPAAVAQAEAAAPAASNQPSPPPAVAQAKAASPAASNQPLPPAAVAQAEAAAPAASNQPSPPAAVAQAEAASPAASPPNPEGNRPAAAPPEAANTTASQSDTAVPDKAPAPPSQPDPVSVLAVTTISPPVRLQELPAAMPLATASPHVRTEAPATAVPPANAPSVETGGAAPSSGPSPGATTSRSEGDRQAAAVSPPAQEPLGAPGGAATAGPRSDQTTPTGSTPQGTVTLNAVRPATPSDAATPAPAIPAAHPVPSAPAPATQFTADDLTRGDAMLAIKDISAARRFYEDAADAGSARAAMAMARTYDPAFLNRLRVIGLRPDPALAATWYRRAAALGSPDAEAQLRTLMPAAR
jgi:type II secretory pathway predicted ATPase ExeA